jgi:hypothetical protein
LIRNAKGSAQAIVGSSYSTASGLTQQSFWWYCLLCHEYYVGEEHAKHDALLCAVRCAVKGGNDGNEIAS